MSTSGSYAWTYPYLCPNCHKPTMYIGDPPGPELCDCWKKAKPLIDLPMTYGWLCSKCGRSNAPWVATCQCGPIATITTGDSTR